MDFKIKSLLNELEEVDQNETDNGFQNNCSTFHGSSLHFNPYEIKMGKLNKFWMKLKIKHCLAKTN